MADIAKVKYLIIGNSAGGIGAAGEGVDRAVPGVCGAAWSKA